MQAKFEKGDNVIVISTNKIGTVNDILKRGNDYAYKVMINGKSTTYQEKFLEKYFDEQEEIIDSWFEGDFASANEFKLFETWYRLKRPIEGNLYSFLASKTIFNPFQFKPLIKFIAAGSEERLFIADEVGVGKTIETGIILTELLARGRLNRKSPILIICPNSLGPKWEKEMRSRFNFRFKLHTPQSLELYLKSAREGYIPQEYMWSIVSLQTFRHTKYMTLLEEVRAGKMNDVWQMLIVDEAHHMRNVGTETNKLGYMLSYMTDMMIMLSATPLNLKDADLFNQMHILNPGMFPDIQTFQALISPVKSLNKSRRLLESKNIEVYDDILNEFEEMKNDSIGRMIFENSLIKNLREDIKNGVRLSDEEIAMYGNILMSASPFDQSFTRTLKREAFNHRVIREPHKIGVDLHKKETEFYNEVINVIGKAYLARGGNERALGFVTNTPRRMATSCIPAMKEYLKWCLDKDTMLEDINETNEELLEDECELKQIPLTKELRNRFEMLYEKAAEVENHDSKYEEFSKAISQMFTTLENKQIIVFSFFVRTLKYLKKRLESDGYKVGLICGEMPVETEGDKIGRYEIMERFEKGEFEILLSSDVGGEGLDFQFCQLMINYDLPYNPMKIEQRIGRVDRFGQKSDKIIVASMYIKDTVDEAIYNALYERIHLVEDSVGLIEPIIGEKITDLQCDIISNKLTEEQLKKRIDEINLAIKQGKLELEHFENNRAELLGDEYFSKTIADMQKTDFVTPSDAMFLTKLCLINWPECKFTQEDENTSTITLSKEIKKKLEIFMRKPGSEGSSGELDVLVKSSGKIKVIFNGSVAASNQGSHFLSPCGFWTRFLLGELEENKRIKKVFSAKANLNEINIPAGEYIVPLLELKTEGFRTELNLAAVPINISNNEAYECNHMNLSRVISKVINDNSMENYEEIDPSEYTNIAIETVENTLNEKIAKLKEENRCRIQAKTKSLQEGSNVRCERLKNKLNTHIEKSADEGKNPSQEFIRLIQAQIENEKSNTEEKMKKLEGKAELALSTSLVAIVYLSVTKGEEI